MCFCDPHNPWQRGTGENTNGLLRQYFPKGTDLRDVGTADLNAVAFRLNTRPRKSLGWCTRRSTEQAVALTFQSPALRRPFDFRQYLSIRYTERLAEAGIESSVGSRSDSYEKALAESVIGLYTIELIRRRSVARRR